MAEIAVLLAIKAGEQLIRKLVDTMYVKASKELSLLLWVREEIQFIIDELEVMSAFLREAEEKQVSNVAARAWVKQVRQLSYAAEDCLDEFSLYLEPQGGQNLMARHRIAAEIKSIKSRVEEVSSRRLRYGITDPTKASSSDDDYNVGQYDPRLEALFIKDSQLVGIDEQRDKLVAWLLEGEQQLRLIMVVGAAGSGKTTITRKAYEDPKVTNGLFSRRAWITVSHEYNIVGLLKEMIRQLSPSPSDEADIIGKEQLITKVKDYLEGKRYLIVFDDMCKIDAWKCLELALPRNDLQSRVMVSTRNNEVAEAGHAQIPGQIHPHKKLSDKQSKELFCRRAFNGPMHTCPKDLETVSQKFLDKCDGLPLAIVSIASVLARKPKTDWENLLGCLGSEFVCNQDLKGMMQVLTFSYNDLPYNVKRCILYLSKFPEDYVINRKNIQRLWVAEGLVVDRFDMTAEEVAESYFNELINRFVILPQVFSANGKVKSFRVHDIMLEVIRSKSMEENFVSRLGKNSNWIPKGVTRRLSVHVENYSKNMSLIHVRSLSMFGDAMPMLISPSFGMLRVLDLDGCNGFDDDCQLEIVVKFLHLKYLSLRNTKVTRLPKSLRNLQNLETLDVRGTCITKLPAEVIKLQQLCFLRGGTYYLDCLRVPRRIGRLRALQELTIMYGAKTVVKELRKLTHLRKLAVVLLPEESGADLCKSLKVMSNSLRSLKVCSLSTLTFLNNLSSPPLLLESLKLHGELITLPNWIGLLNNVVKMHLDYCELVGDKIIAVLGSLPKLVKLVLDLLANKEERLWFGDKGFPSLKLLHLESIDVRILSFEGGAMCHLESVSVKGPDRWKDPDMRILGIKDLPKLKEINIDWMRKEYLAAANEEVNGHPNHPRVVAHHIF